MAFVDDNGLWHIAGRDDDMIVSGGENLYPQEVENLSPPTTVLPTWQ